MVPQKKSGAFFGRLVSTSSDLGIKDKKRSVKAVKGVEKPKNRIQSELLIRQFFRVTHSFVNYHSSCHSSITIILK